MILCNDLEGFFIVFWLFCHEVRSYLSSSMRKLLSVRPLFECLSGVSDNLFNCSINENVRDSFIVMPFRFPCAQKSGGELV
jgi:hypothetical protein